MNILEKVITESIINRFDKIKLVKEKILYLDVDHIYSYYILDTTKSKYNDKKVRIEEYSAKTLEQFELDLIDLGYKKFTDSLEYENIIKKHILDDMSFHITNLLELEYYMISEEYNIAFIKINESFKYGKRDVFSGNRSFIAALYKEDLLLNNH